jgi:hypothetical protein
MMDAIAVHNIFPKVLNFLYAYIPNDKQEYMILGSFQFFLIHLFMVLMTLVTGLPPKTQ